MNILIFSPVPSHPQNGGSPKRVFTLTKYLQNIGHKIHFVYFTQKEIYKNSFDAMQSEWDSLTIINKTKTIRNSAEGYELDEWYQDDIHTVINEVIDLFNIDVVLVNYIMQSKLLEFVPDNILKIIDTHDIFSDRHLLFNKNIPENYTWYSVSKEDEIKALKRADIVLAIQKNEAEYFSSVIDRKVKIINHLEDKHVLDHSYDKLKKIGFIGGPNYVNEHSLNDLLNVFIDHPISDKVQIIVAGSVIKHINFDHKNILLRGPVEKLEDFYNEVDMVINPSVFGTGLKIKSVEALSYGVPIVSTVIGFDGIVSHHRCHQLKTPEEMMECIQNIYNDPNKLSELANQSVEIFSAYETNVKREIESLFDPEMEFPGNDLIFADPEKQEQTIQQLYNQMQTVVFEKAEKEKELLNRNKKLQAEIKDIKKDFIVMLQAIQRMMHFPIKEHPVKKYRAYKLMLKTYFSLKKQISKKIDL